MPDKDIDNRGRQGQGGGSKKRRLKWWIEKRKQRFERRLEIGKQLPHQ